MADRPIDLRSDTVTRPSPEMRRAMAEAEVGDDVYGEDPTVRRLEATVAELTGKAAGLFVPSGTMANQLAIRCQTEPGDEVILDAGGHSFHFETGGTAAISGVQVNPIPTAAGVFDGLQLAAAIRPAGVAFPRSRMVIVENTHNFGGGTVWPLETLRDVARVAREHRLAVHLDGARLMNAVVASGVPAATFAAEADSVSLCLSKGLGAPVGTVLAGDGAFIDRARRFRKMLGGGMRQAGILAAAGLHALAHHVDRLADDHARARRLAEGLDGIDGLSVDLARVETNIVFVTVEGGDAAGLADRLSRQGVLASATGPDQIRLVTHLDVDDAGVDRALEVFAAVR